jgi:hypothetical protein
LAVEQAVGEMCAHAAGEAVRAIAGNGTTVSKSELLKEMKASYPNLFEDDNGKRRAYRGGRAIKAAVDCGWITVKGDRYSPGPETPPILPGDLPGDTMTYRLATNV